MKIISKVILGSLVLILTSCNVIRVNSDFTGTTFSAAAVGVENFFMEVHEDPDNSPSDGPNILHLKDFEHVLKSIKQIQHTL